MFSAVNKKVQIHGAVNRGFESVRQLFEQQLHTMAERQVQLCVYHKGAKVVDLWADLSGGEQFSADSLVNVFSSGKSLEAIAIASLVDKGLISYDAKITDYWPEFGANGKADLTVADLMRHEAGLANFDTSLDIKDLFADNIKQNTIGRIIEQQTSNYERAGNGRREYHALTRGWIVNELFRRVDPQRRTIGEYLREDISGPLDADVVVGASPDELKRVTPVKALGFGYQLMQSLLPRFMGRRIVHNIFQILRRLIALMPALLRSAAGGPPPPLVGMKTLDFFNDHDFSRGETPSANAKCSARGLAKVAAMLAAGGRLDGREYLGETGWHAMHAHPLEASLGPLLMTRFTQGGVDCFKPCPDGVPRLEREFNEGREGFFGWMGLGGALFQWHPELEIGFAFVPTSLHVLDLLNERGKRYQAEVLRCARELAREAANQSS